MIRTIIQLPEEVHQQLREKAYREKISISAICREAIEVNTRLNIETHTKLKDYAKSSGKSLASIIEETLNKYLEEETPMKQVTSKTLEIIEELGNIPVATIDDLESYIAELKEFGFTAYPDNNIDSLLDVLTRLLLEVRGSK